MSVLRNRCPTTGPDAGKASGVPQRTSPQRTFMSLPTEIHLAISDFLIYPDALSLKHTSAYFYSLVDTGINLKVEWLVERRSLHLECPNDRRCDLGSDLRFCRGSVP
ncbi:f-box domain-containing protein [Fusarium pseudocircinatum]|uniref:F-box domain-containing protein n=1 Tax=Fusarium pseudocircinatum TaxID=56676 RepID=A0A8H5KTM5_9HYPO|nr:f-box domain-containing protein [Fusarium pseudocircinatum]